MDANTLIENYVKLRDKRDEINREAKEKVKQLDALMSKLEGMLMAVLEETGGDSLKTPAGTVFKTTVSSVTVGDWDSLLEWIKKEEAWNFLDHRVSKSAVQEYSQQTKGDLPPGVNFSATQVVQIRRG